MGLINARNKTGHVSFKDTGNQLYDPFRLQNSPYFCVFKYALRARKTLKPRFTDFFTDFEKKTDCFAVYDPLIIAKRNKYFVILKKYTIK